MEKKGFFFKIVEGTMGQSESARYGERQKMMDYRRGTEECACSRQHAVIWKFMRLTSYLGVNGIKMKVHNE